MLIAPKNWSRLLRAVTRAVPALIAVGAIWICVLRPQAWAGTMYADNFEGYAPGNYPFPSNPLPGWNATPSQSGLLPGIVDLGGGNKALRMDSFGGGASGWALYSTAVLPGSSAGWTYQGTAKWIATYHPSLPYYGIGGLLLSSAANGIDGNNWIWVGFSRGDYDGTGKSSSLPVLEYRLGGVSGSVPLGGPAFRDFPEHAPVGLTVTRTGGTITLSITTALDGTLTKSHTFTGEQAAALDSLRFAGVMTYFSVFEYDNLNLVSGPQISVAGTPAALTTAYGTASAPTSFSVSGLNMGSGILVTPPAGFEVSTDNVNFTPTVTVGAAGTIANTTVYLRLAATASAGTKSGDIILASSGADTATVATAASTVEPKAVTGSFTAASKVYDGTTAATVTGRSLTGVVNGDDVSLSGGTAAFADPAVGTGKTVTLTGAVLSGAQAGNYTLASVATATADITAPADGLTTWLSDAPATPENLARYAIGGATGISAPSEAISCSTDANKFSLTAIVRTDDPKLQVTGEACADLGAWSADGVTHQPAASQSGVSAGCERRIYSVDRTNNPGRMFLRLRAVYSPY